MRFRKIVYLCTRNRFWGREIPLRKSLCRVRKRCPDGGIGRRVGLKHQCRKACRFDPGSGYQFLEIPCKPCAYRGFSITLHGNNRQMRISRRRRLSAWMLLSVFVPMLAFSLVHYHEKADSGGGVCVDCAHHVQHSGHFSAGSASFDDCLVCEFASLSYVKAAETVFSAVPAKSEAVAEAFVRPVVHFVWNHQSPRAPPVIV